MICSLHFAENLHNLLINLSFNELYGNILIVSVHNFESTTKYFAK